MTSAMTSLSDRIELSHQESSNDKLQEEVIREVYSYLGALDSSLHLFCDPNHYPYAIHALILFSFMGNEALNWYKPKIESLLSSCKNCLKKFHEGRCQLSQDFLTKRHIAFQNVKEFNDIILNWEADRVSLSLENILAHLDQPAIVLNNDLNLTLTECLYAPGLFRVRPTLSALFRHLFIPCLSSGVFTADSRIFPSLIYFLFEGNEEKIWSLEFLKTRPVINSENWDLTMQEEFTVHLLNIQNPNFYSDTNCIIFWKNMLPFMHLMDLLTLQKVATTVPDPQKSFPFKVVSLSNVLCNQTFAFLELPLPVLLSVVNLWLSKSKQDFWKLVRPFTFINFLDSVFGSPHYRKFLKLPSPSAGSSYQYKDLIHWLGNLYVSLSLHPAQKQQCGLRISLFLMSDLSNSWEFISALDLALKLLIDCSSVVNELYGSQLPIELLMKADSRNFINMKSTFLVEIAAGDSVRFAASIIGSEAEVNLRSKAVMVISNAMVYDISYFAESTKRLKQLDDSSLGNVSFNKEIWELMTAKIKPNDTALVIQFMLQLSSMCCIIPINEKIYSKQIEENDRTNKSTSLLKKAGEYNTRLLMILEQIRKLLDRCMTFDGLALKTILMHPQAADGFWSCILSSNKAVYQAAANILYEAFDVEGRLEGARAILGMSLSSVLSSLSQKLSWIISIGFHDPFPGAVRVLMDIVNSLNNPINGVFIELRKSSVPDIIRKDLVSFWKQCWKFLDFIYHKTLYWAKVFSLSELTDFTRDTLELSHMLLDCFRTLQLILENESLLPLILETFNNMLVWLRLGDPSLLSSCVTLIFKTMDLSEELNVKMNASIIELLALYGCKAKKYNNRLSEKQRADILDRARSLNAEVVDRIVETHSSYREHGSQTEPKIEVVDIDSETEETPVVKNEPTSNIKSIRQSDLSRFLSRSSSPVVAPPPKLPPQKTSLLLAAKLSLASKRNNAMKPPIAPAPPRPAGFNRKLGSDSESESSSDDEADNLFHPISKEKIAARNAKLKTISMVPQRIPSMNRNIKKKVDQREIDAHNMRMRLNVDFNPLYTEVLGWDYRRVNNFPTDNTEMYTKISDSFPTPQEYVKTFQPLLFLECWQAIQQSKEIGAEKPFPIVIGSRATTNSFFEVYASVKREIVQDRKISDSDMIVLSFIPEFKSSEDNAIPPRESVKNSKVCCLAKVKEIKMVNFEFCDITFKVSSTNNQLTSFITPRTELFGMKVMQMTTIEREYSSLKGLSYYDLSKQIIQAIPNRPQNLESQETNLMKNLYDVNQSQAQAIAGSVKSNGFSLIQGPPGTGKTKTILGIVGYILTSPKMMGASTISIPGSRNMEPVKKKERKTVLICAPSNAAVDELVLRLCGGIKNSKGDMFNPRVVRVGRSDAVNPAVRDATLEELVDKELELKGGTAQVVADPKIRLEHTLCVQERNNLKSQLLKDGLTAEQVDSLTKKLQKCVQRKNELGKQLDEQREKISKSGREREMERRAIQTRILSEAQVICSTLSGSAHDVLASLSLVFDTVVIDEAAQCIELSAIIPLRYGCKKCIMVGDPNQLPPTVLSQAAASFLYEQSLFVRMQKQHPESVYLLDVQYRMHPEISRFPSAEFYKSKLIDGPNMLKLNTRPWHSHPAMKPYLFFDMVEGKQLQSQRTKSYFNTAEARVALELVDKLFHDFPDENWSGRIGIISPYKEQVRTIREVFVKKYGYEITREIDFNTVDGFQGQEKEIIIMSCVRASESGGVGFLSDVRRMNVSLTRSKTSLWILGTASSLQRNRVWSDLIKDAYSRHLMFEARPGFLKSSVKSSKISESPEPEPIQAPPVQVAPQKVAKVVQLPKPKLADMPKQISTSDLSKIRIPKKTNTVIKRTTVPFEKKKRNVLSSESLKNRSGVLAKPDQQKNVKSSTEPVKSSSSGILPSGPMSTQHSESSETKAPSRSGVIQQKPNSYEDKRDLAHARAHTLSPVPNQHPTKESPYHDNSNLGTNGSVIPKKPKGVSSLPRRPEMTGTRQDDGNRSKIEPNNSGSLIPTGPSKRYLENRYTTTDPRLKKRKKSKNGDKQKKSWNPLTDEAPDY